MAHRDTVSAARAYDGTLIDGEDGTLAEAQRYNLHPRLHARPLLGQHELAAFELSRIVEQERCLQREHPIAVEVLVQAVVVARTVAKQKRRRPGLARGVAPFQELRMAVRERCTL